MEKAIITAAVIIAGAIVSVAIINSEKEDDSSWAKSDKDYAARRVMSDAFWTARRIND